MDGRGVAFSGLLIQAGAFPYSGKRASIFSCTALARFERLYWASPYHIIFLFFKGDMRWDERIVFFLLLCTY